jgi:hypothetical protein
VPPLWFLWIVVGAVLAPFWPAFALAYAVSVACYLGLVVLESLRLARVKHASARRLPWVFAAIHLGFAWGYCKEVWAGLRASFFGMRFVVFGQRQAS